MDIYTKDGEKIAHLLHYMPTVKDGEVILVKLGKKFGQTKAERDDMIATLSRLVHHRAKIVVVDESTIIEEIDPREIRPRIAE